MKLIKGAFCVTDKKDNKSVSESTQIDDFAKALLDKKTDYKVYKDFDFHSKEQNRDLNKKVVEHNFSSALDALRQERGQKPISEEEKEFYLDSRESHNKNDTNDHSSESDDLDFTTDSLSHTVEPDITLKHVKENWSNISTETKDFKQLNKNDEMIQLKEPISDSPRFTQSKEKSKEKGISHLNTEKQKKKKKWIVILFILVLLFISLGAYTYKVYIYDPQNIPSQSQINSTNKLKAYADEYGSDMMLEAEKLELLDLDKEYQKLLDKQKDEINLYFKEQTGKTYKKVLKDVKSLSEKVNDESNPDYANIVSFLNSWKEKSDQDKANIVNLRPMYEGLSTNLQSKIDDKARKVSSKTFISLCSDYDGSKQLSSDSSEDNNLSSDKLDKYKELYNQYQSEYNQYASYADSLNSDLAYYQSMGYDTSEILSQIETNNQLMNQALSNMNYYENLISSN